VEREKELPQQPQSLTIAPDNLSTFLHILFMDLPQKKEAFLVLPSSKTFN